MDLENFCQLIQQWLFNFPSQPRSLLGDLEVCIGVSDSITPDTASASEISLSPEMIQSIAKYLGNEQRVTTLVSPMPEEDVRFSEQLSEQLFRDGMSTRLTYVFRVFLVSRLLTQMFFFFFFFRFDPKQVIFHCQFLRSGG